MQDSRFLSADIDPAEDANVNNGYDQFFAAKND